MPSTPLPRRHLLGLTALAATGFALTAAGTARAADTADEVAAWIKRTARPLRSTDPTAADRDLGSLRQVVGSASVVGLGEASHGSRELFRVKHRMLRYLVERLGFRTLAFEQDFAWGTRIDDYVMTGEGDPRQLVAGMSSPLWSTEEILDVITWMRSYNAEHRDKVRFVGTDLLMLHESSFTAITAYVDRVAPKRAGELAEHLDPLRPRGTYYEHFGWYAGLSAAQRQEFVEHAHAVVELVSGLAVESVDDEYAHQHARAVAGWYEYYADSASLRPVRERYIAESIAWWKRVTGGRIAYWAADVHVAAASEVEFAMPGDVSRGAWAGNQLRERFGRGYVAVGTAIGSGAITSGWAPPAAYPVAAPTSELLEATLSEAGSPVFLLNLRARAPRPVREWLTAPTRLRMIHPSYTGGDAAAHTMSAGSLRELFDAVLYVDETTPSRLL